MGLIIATHNLNKVDEFKRLLPNYDILCAKDYGVSREPEEDGKTFSDNSFIKANFLYTYLTSKNLLKPRDIVLADDSGLCIDCLNGEPGINSSRYYPDDMPYSERNLRLIKKVDETFDKDRLAHFVCDLCAIENINDKKILKHFEGIFYGKIALSPSGNNGFGYDPIFLCKDYDYKITSSDLSPNEKSKIDHRAKAVEKLLEYLNTK